jgi:hypothetical protein
VKIRAVPEVPVVPAMPVRTALAPVVPPGFWKVTIKSADPTAEFWAKVVPARQASVETARDREVNRIAMKTVNV